MGSRFTAKSISHTPCFMSYTIRIKVVHLYVL